MQQVVRILDAMKMHQPKWMDASDECCYKADSYFLFVGTNQRGIKISRKEKELIYTEHIQMLPIYCFSITKSVLKANSFTF